MISKSILVQHIPSHDQIADILKLLSFQFFTWLRRNKLQVLNPSSLQLRGHVRDNQDAKHILVGAVNCILGAVT